MQPAHFLPPESLNPYIAFYGIIDVDKDFDEPYVSPPLGLCGIIICLEGDNNATLMGNRFLNDNYSATGQVTAPMVGDIRGKNKTLMVFIQPCGLYQLFGINMALLTNASMPLRELLGNEEFKSLAEKLAAASNHESLVQVMNAFFLSKQPVFAISPKVTDALDFIHVNKGNVTIKEIESNCYIAARSLERHFKMNVGLSPKDYAKIFRFKCLINFINQNPGVTWSTLCEQNGYYDQSHLTRYFTRFLKLKPTEMVNANMDFISYLLQDL